MYELYTKVSRRNWR